MCVWGGGVGPRVFLDQEFLFLLSFKCPRFKAFTPDKQILFYAFESFQQRLLKISSQLTYRVTRKYHITSCVNQCRRIKEFVMTWNERLIALL